MHSEIHSAYLLHQRPYRETSVIADFLTQEHGKISAVCKGIRGNSRPARLNRAVLQPFSCLAINWFGRGELKTLSSVECLTPSPKLEKHQLYAALYLNELLVRLLQAGEENAGFYENYQLALQSLFECENAGDNHLAATEIVLRGFEFRLLSALGFSIDFAQDAVTGDLVEAANFYSYDAARGFSPAIDDKSQTAGRESFSGEILLALNAMDFSSTDARQAAKKITRLALAPHLGDKPLASRELYRRSRQD